MLTTYRERLVIDLVTAKLSLFTISPWTGIGGCNDTLTKNKEAVAIHAKRISLTHNIVVLLHIWRAQIFIRL